MENGAYVPLIIAAGGGGRGYSSQAETQLEQMDYEVGQQGRNGKSYAAGTHVAASASGGWTCISVPMMGLSTVEYKILGNDTLLHHKQCQNPVLSCCRPVFVTVGRSCMLSLSSAFLPQWSVYRAFTIDEEPENMEPFNFKS